MHQIIIEKGKKIKAFIMYKKDILRKNFFSEQNLIILIIVTISIFSFLLGELNMYYKIHQEKKEKITLTKNTKKISYKILASKKGIRYYYPWCSSVYNIKKENLIEFENKKDAEKNGLTLASGCEEPDENL